MIWTFYHRTNAYEAISSEGFRDTTGNYLCNWTFTGVWISDCPLDENEGADGDQLLEIRLDIEDEALSNYEVAEAGKPYREWCVPASVLNSAEIRLLTEDEEDQIQKTRRHIFRGIGFVVWQHPDGPTHPPLHVPGKWYWLPLNRDNSGFLDETLPPWWRHCESREEAERTASLYLETK